MSESKEAVVAAGAVHIHDDVFDNGEEIISILRAEDAWQDALVGTGAGEMNKSLRHNTAAVINPFDFRVEPVLYTFVRTVWHYLNDYAAHYEVAFSALEPVTINRYMPGDRYLPHADAGPGQPRVISAVAYLNDVDEGGETEFSLFDLSVQPKAGRLIIFPSNYAYRHAALPPADGVKYAAAFWTRQ